MTDGDASRPSIAMPILTTERLRLEPMTSAHAEELLSVLADRTLYAITGGEPPSLPVLRARITRWERRRSPDGGQIWLNWLIRLKAGELPVGHVQATVEDDVATIAYVVSTSWQKQGLASESLRTVLAWLTQQGVRTFEAHIQTLHSASEAVARAVGLTPTGAHVSGGEQIWSTRRPDKK